ncbi:MAG: hypothetical protein ACF8MJ_06325 [Phycisphaerales bacterium JB050]
MTNEQSLPSQSGPVKSRRKPKRGPQNPFVSFISGVPLGIGLLTVLFLYATIGSAGIVYPVFGPDGFGWKHDMVRQWRVFEMTEFEWFHTWFFAALCVAICVNLSLATVLRIPFNALKAGVWMIHAGIILLAIGSVIYFGTKIEGDAPVIRRQVIVQLPDGSSQSMPAMPGVRRTVEIANGPMTMEVVSVLPQYELLTGEYAGKKDFAVTVRVVPSDGPEFFRQLLASYPQFTEDSVAVDPAANGGRPMQRVKNLEEFGGRSLVRENLSMSLDYLPQDSFWIRDSWALHLREVGTEEWVERPIRRLPRYNDYIPNIEDIWATVGARYPIQSLSISVPSVSESDPLRGEPIRIEGYLRYAVEQERFVSGGTEFNPLLDLQLERADGVNTTFQLLAFHPIRRTGADGNLGFFWASTEEEFESILDDAGPARLRFSVPREDGDPVVIETAITDLELQQQEVPLKAIGTTGWQYRVQATANDLEIQRGRASHFAIVELVSPGGDVFLRYAATDPRETRDIDPQSDPPYVAPDPSIQVEYTRVHMPSISFVGRVGERKFVMIERLRNGGVRQQTVGLGDRIDLGGGNTLRITRFAPNAMAQTKPVIVPRNQRDADNDRSHHYAMIKARIGDRSEWLTFHRYSQMSETLALGGLTRHEPWVYTASDGRQIEITFGRQLRDLPAPVVLEDFTLSSHIGGFTGQSGQIRNWISELKFLPESGEPVTREISVNNPKQFGGYAYFQSFWDAPRPNQGSAGMAFTGLGIGNREGVWTALIGSCLSVIGMVYTFYVKPIIRRKRRERVLAGLESTSEGENS